MKTPPHLMKVPIQLSAELTMRQAADLKMTLARHGLLQKPDSCPLLDAIATQIDAGFDKFAARVRAEAE